MGCFEKLLEFRERHIAAAPKNTNTFSFKFNMNVIHKKLHEENHLPNLNKREIY